jgi:hypothetical protein
MGDTAFAVLVIAQIALLVMFYGFGVIMPWFVVWLPALFLLFLLALWVLFVVVIIAVAVIVWIVAAIFD